MFYSLIAFILTMDLVQWYSVAVGAILILFFLFKIWEVLTYFLFPKLCVIFMRFVQYPALFKKWIYFGTTRLEAFILFLYISVNIIVLFLFYPGLESLQQRAAALALTNLCPLFFQGETHPLADLIGVSIVSQFFSHRWFGWVSFLHVLLHIAIALSLHPRPSQSILAGYIVCSQICR